MNELYFSKLNTYFVIFFLSEESTQQHKKGSVRVYFKNNWCKKYTLIRATTVDTFIGKINTAIVLIF